jgi:hypothetical protein
MITLKDWQSSFDKLPTVQIASSHTVEGVCKEVRGDRAFYAKVVLRFSPASKLAFSHSIGGKKPSVPETVLWQRSAYLGVLDVMLAHAPTPVTGFRCEIEEMDFHMVDSSNEAFRLAGRQAALEFLKSETAQL